MNDNNSFRKRMRAYFAKRRQVAPALRRANNNRGIFLEGSNYRKPRVPALRAKYANARNRRSAVYMQRPGTKQR